MLPVGQGQGKEHNYTTWEHQVPKYKIKRFRKGKAKKVQDSAWLKSNKVLACYQCNMEKGARKEEVFLASLKDPTLKTQDRTWSTILYGTTSPLGYY
jgi:hypothetical protein